MQDLVDCGSWIVIFLQFNCLFSYSRRRHNSYREFLMKSIFSWFISSLSTGEGTIFTGNFLCNEYFPGLFCRLYFSHSIQMIYVQLNFSIQTFQPPHTTISTGFYLCLYSWISQFKLSNCTKYLFPPGFIHTCTVEFLNSSFPTAHA